MSEGLAGLQGLHELHDGGDSALGQQHAAQAAEAAEGLLQLGRQGARWEVLDQDHGLASLGRRLQGGNQHTWGNRREDPPPDPSTDLWSSLHHAPLRDLK